MALLKVFKRLLNKTLAALWLPRYFRRSSHNGNTETNISDGYVFVDEADFVSRASQDGPVVAGRTSASGLPPSLNERMSPEDDFPLPQPVNAYYGVNRGRRSRRPSTTSHQSLPPFPNGRMSPEDGHPLPQYANAYNGVSRGRRSRRPSITSHQSLPPFPHGRMSPEDDHPLPQAVDAADDVDRGRASIATPSTPPGAIDSPGGQCLLPRHQRSTWIIGGSDSSPEEERDIFDDQHGPMMM
ncbi:hypothetical protein HGRIS_013705 [Hohenbuehelia grisea]|uniref:Uncharacterized protein n=1 Tax=Hohenbuehelia grisea TaxID=104357 RepID=A0ABR3IWD8_9AGAR